MKWYAPYLETYERPLEQVSQTVLQQVKEKIAAMQSDAPLASVIAIAHNEETRLLSCLHSLCDNSIDFPVELLVINNNSTDGTEQLLRQLGVCYYNERQKGPGHARQCGLNHARGRYHLCIDSDTIYPPHYISTMVHALQCKGVACAYGLWSFIPDERHSPFGLWLIETLRDCYLRLQQVKRPELNVRGMVFAFHTELGRKVGFRTDIIRGEDGSMALAMKPYGKLKLVTSRRARPITGNGTISQDGGLRGMFLRRAKKALQGFAGLFVSKKHYEDSDDNLLAP